MAKKLENEIQKEIKKHIFDRGVLIERIQSGIIKMGYSYMHLATKGHPDLVCYLGGGKTLFIEVKKPGGTLSVDQKEYHSRLEALGHTVITVDNLNDIVEYFSRLGY